MPKYSDVALHNQTCIKALLILLIVAQLATAESPKFGWKQTYTETFVLNPIHSKFFKIGQGLWRFDIQAETAVRAGVMPPTSKPRRYILKSEFGSFYCRAIDVIESSTQCTVTAPSAVLAVRDKRGPISLAFGAGAGMASVDPHTAAVANSAGSLGVADSKVKDNRIKITFYKWTCVENCQ